MDIAERNDCASFNTFSVFILFSASRPICAATIIGDEAKTIRSSALKMLWLQGTGLH